MTNALSSLLDHHLSAWPVPNAAGAVFTNGTTVATAGDQNRIFELASVTKLLSAYSFMVAVEEGVFDLDTVITEQGATVRHLLSHAGGVGFREEDSRKPVGTRRIYSSYGFELLGDRLVSETQMGLGEYFTAAVFEPLGMVNTTLWGSPGHEARSTVADLRRFVAEIMVPTLLDPATVAEMWTPQYPELNGIVPGYGMFKPCPWGLGFEIKGAKTPHWTGTQLPSDTVGHFGQSGTFVWVHPPTRRGAIVLTDRAFGEWAKPVWTRLNDELWQALAT